MRSTEPSKSTAMVVWRVSSAIDTNGKYLEVTCMPPSGSEFEIGKTEVWCMAEDEKREELACNFFVTINGTFTFFHNET